MADGDKEWLAIRTIGAAITNDNDGIRMKGTGQNQANKRRRQDLRLGNAFSCFLLLDECSSWGMGRCGNAECRLCMEVGCVESGWGDCTFGAEWGLVVAVRVR